VARQKDRLGEIRGRVVNLSSVVGAWWFAGASTRGITPRTSSSAVRRAVVPANTPDTAPAALVNADPGTAMDMRAFSAEEVAAMVGGAAPPAPPPADDPTTTMTLLEFAMLTAELQVFPEFAERAFAKYGLSDRLKRSVINAAWNARLEKDADERSEYHRLHERAVRHWMSSSTQR
jgi:hypothetical protein